MTSSLLYIPSHFLSLFCGFVVKEYCCFLFFQVFSWKMQHNQCITNITYNINILRKMKTLLTTLILLSMLLLPGILTLLTILPLLTPLARLFSVNVLMQTLLWVWENSTLFGGGNTSNLFTPKTCRGVTALNKYENHALFKLEQLSNCPR